MRKLIVSIETFTDMISGLIASGVTFTANEDSGMIVIIFDDGC